MDAVIYGARSTDDRKGSIPDQLRQAREMAEREGVVALTMSLGLVEREATLDDHVRAVLPEPGDLVAPH